MEQDLQTFDRHIIRRLFLGYLALIGVLVLCFVTFHYVEYVDDFIARGATNRQVFFGYYPNYVPEIIKLISPLALFLAAVFLTSKLAEEMQLTALMTSGVSLYRLFVPYLLIGLLSTVSMFFFNGYLVPRTNAVRLQFEEAYFKESTQRLDSNNIHRQNAQGSVLLVRFYDKDERVAHTVSLQQYDDDNRLARRIDAMDMRWMDSTASWQMQRGVVHDFLEDRMVRQSFITMDTTLNVFPRDLMRTEQDVEALSIPEARDYILSLRRAGVSDIESARVQFQSKFSYPFANLILVLIAVPFASVRLRRGKAVQVAAALFIAFVYLATIKLAEPFGYTGTLHPVLAAWAGHVLFFLGGVVMLFTVRK